MCLVRTQEDRNEDWFQTGNVEASSIEKLHLLKPHDLN